MLLTKVFLKSGHINAYQEPSLPEERLSTAFEANGLFVKFKRIYVLG